MVDLNRIERGTIRKADRICIYGPPGVGKTTWASDAPNALVLDLERGATAIDVRRAPVESWGELAEWLTAVERKEIAAQTVVIDSLTRAEELLHRQILGESPTALLSKHDGGYGRGDEQAQGHWRVLLASLERLWASGTNIILVAHSTVKQQSEPDGATYDRFMLDMRPRASALVHKWCDFVLFARPETVAVKVDGKMRATSTGQRVLRTAWSAAYDAKARTETPLPDPLPLSWQAFADAVVESASTEALTREINGLLASMDESYQKRVRDALEKTKTPTARQLIDVLTRIRAAQAQTQTQAQ